MFKNLIWLSLFFSLSSNATFYTSDIVVENSCNLPSQTASRVLLLDGSKNVVSSSVTSATLLFLDATSSIQTQLNGKQASLGFTPENVSNKTTNLTSPDNTKYPTSLAVANAIAAIPAGVTSFNTRTGAVTSQAGDYSTSIVSEGSNLYFTNARGIGSTLTGYTSGAGTVSSSDSILSAIQKLNGNTAALVTGVSSFNSRTGAITPQSSDYSAFYEVPLTFSTGLTRTLNTVTVNTSQNISRLNNLTTDGFVKTSGASGSLSIDTSTYVPTSRQILTSTPLSGGGDLSADRTISITGTDLTDSGTDGISITNGAKSVLSAGGVSISQHVSDTTHNGYLASNDWNTFNGKGSVSSVNVTGPVGIMTSAGGPITTTGTIALSLSTQTKNTFLAAPAAATGTPTFRVIVGSDLPNPTASTLGGIESLVATSHQWINTISTSGVPSGTQPAFTDISGTATGAQLPNPSATTLGGIQSLASSASRWINQISTSGVPSATQPAFTDISGTASTGQIPSLSSLYCSLSGCTMAGILNAGSNKITNVTDPTSAQDAATKNYVDTVASGIEPIQGVYVATIGSNIAGTYANGVGGVGATFTTTSTSTFTLDGATPGLTNRILIKDQTLGFQNGVYTFTTLPVGGVSGAVFTRSLDYNTAADMNSGNIIPVLNGTINAPSGNPTLWIQTATITTVGTDSLVFVKFNAGGSGTVTSVSVATANGFAGTVATSTTTPAITISTTVTGLLKGNGTSVSASTPGDITDAASSLSVKPSITLVSDSVAGNIASLSGFPVVDGITAADGTLILLTAQTTGSQNGPWVAHSGAWTRPTWYASGSTVQAAQFITSNIRLGTTYIGSMWKQTAVGPITIDTTATTWTIVPRALNSSTVTGILPNANTTADVANTANAIVLRDSSGAFNSGSIFANGTIQAFGSTSPSSGAGVELSNQSGTGRVLGFDRGVANARIPLLMDGSTLTLDTGNTQALTIDGSQAVSILKGLTMTGTGGTGFIQFNAQSSKPSTPSGSYREYADASNRFSIINSAGNAITVDSSTVSADRVYTLQDVAGQIALTNFMFGDGSDGNVTCSGGSTLVRDMYYNNLTVNAGCAIVTGGYRIFVLGTLDLTNSPVNGIAFNGTNGSGSGGTAGGSAGTASTAITIGGRVTGIAGGAGTTGAGAVNGAATAGNNGGGSGNGGAGGAGNGGATAGGAARAGSVASGAVPFRRYAIEFLRSGANITCGSGAPGGASGGGDGTTAGRGGGGGGSGGGCLYIAARTITRSSSTTTTGSISATGGVGGDGGSNAGAGSVGGGSGAGGAGGGWIYIAYGSLTGTSKSTAIDVSGGTGGAGHNGFGASNIGGGGGQGGTAGRVTLYNVSTNTSTETGPGSGGTAGTPASGLTGGPGGAGETSQVAL